MKKSSSYRETFRQHRLLLSLPIILATLIAGWFVLGAAKSYQSSASIWVDTPGSISSTLSDLNPALTPPSTQEQDVLTELLSTRDFVDAVAYHSLLAHYLAAHPSSGFSPTALLKQLTGGSGTLKALIAGSFGPKQLTTSVPGPQVLEITYSGPTPAVAQSTLNAIVQELQASSVRFTRVHDQNAIAYYQSQVRGDITTLNSARSQLSTYRAQHPSATSSSDPNLAALSAAATAASNQLSQDNANLNSAVSTLKGGSPGATLSVIDGANVPTGPTSGKKKVIEGLLGGVLAGALISLLGTIALTRKPDVWEDEIAAGQDLASDGPAPGGVTTGGGHTVEPVTAGDVPSLTVARRLAAAALRQERDEA